MKTAIIFILSFLFTNIFAQETAVKTNLKDFEGIYEQNPKRNIVIIAEGNNLVATLNNGSKFTLEYVNGDKFEIKSEGTQVVFVRDADKNVIKFISYENNKSIEAKKVGPLQKSNAVKINKNLIEYTGEYNSEEKEEPLIISEEGGKLYAVAGGHSKYELKHVKGDDFEIPEISIVISFTRNSKKEIAGVKVIDPDGKEITGKKAVPEKK